MYVIKTESKMLNSDTRGINIASECNNSMPSTQPESYTYHIIILTAASWFIISSCYLVLCKFEEGVILI